MKTLEQKQIALLERMGWKKIYPRSGFDTAWESPGGNVFEGELPTITHEFMDEVWEWMKNIEGDEGFNFIVEYENQLKKLHPKNDLAGYPNSVLAHLTPLQKFEAACKALGIE